MPASIPAEILQQSPVNALSSFVVGQDDTGHWIVVETHGLGGGFFRSRKDAIRYALGQAVGRPEAVTFTDDPIAMRM